MIQRATSVSKTVQVFAVLAVAMLAAGMPIAPLNASASSSTPYIVQIGAPADFAVGDLNTHSFFAGCVDTRCRADTSAGIATGAASVQDTNTPSTGEAGVGWWFKTIRACTGQSDTQPFTITYQYNYSFSKGGSALVQTTSTSDLVRSNVTHTGSPGGSSILAPSGTAWANLSRTSANNTHYKAVVSGKATAAMTDTPVPGETAQGNATVWPLTLRVDFKDTVPPSMTAARIEPLGNEANALFLGYSNASTVSVYGRATDAPANATVGMSCVKQIHFESNLNSEIRPVGWSQGEVGTVNGFSAEGRHQLAIFPRDHANNQPLSPDQYFFVLDRVQPGTGLNISSSPNGFAQWYANTSPLWLLDCNADPTGLGQQNVAPCRSVEVSKNGTKPYQSVGLANNAASQTAEEGSAVSVTVRSVDAAGNRGAPLGSDTIKVDVTKPTTNIPRSTSQHFPGTGWHKAVTTIDFDCVSDATSGCGMIETSTDNGATWSLVDSYTCTTDSLLNIKSRIWDVAGNRVDNTNLFGCDFNAPLGVTVTNKTQVHKNSRNNVTYSNANVSVPIIRWAPAVDQVNTTTGSSVTSGIHLYQVEIDDEIQPTTVAASPNPEYSLTGISEGSHTIRVRPIDKAGNFGPWSVPYELFVDRVLPAGGFYSPVANGLMFYGTPVGVGNLPTATLPGTGQVPRQLQSVVIGKTIVGARATDSGSLLDRMELIEDLDPYYLPTDSYAGDATFGGAGDQRWDNNETAPGCVTLDATYADCSASDGRRDDDTELSVATHSFFTRTFDRAENRLLSRVDYVRVNTAALEQKCSGFNGRDDLAGIPCTQILFTDALNITGLSLDPSDFLQYVALAVPDSPAFDVNDFDPLNPLQIAGTSPDLTTPVVNDYKNTLVGQKYHYKIYIQKTDSSYVDAELPVMYKTYTGVKGNLNADWITWAIENS